MWSKWYIRKIRSQPWTFDWNDLMSLMDHSQIQPYFPKHGPRTTRFASCTLRRRITDPHNHGFKSKCAQVHVPDRISIVSESSAGQWSPRRFLSAYVTIQAYDTNHSAWPAKTHFNQHVRYVTLYNCIATFNRVGRFPLFIELEYHSCTSLLYLLCVDSARPAVLLLAVAVEAGDDNAGTGAPQE
jgi:hypothetical protein